MSHGAKLIAEERRRQIEEMGWTPSHDDGHDAHELAWAAACYAAPAPIYAVREYGLRPDVEFFDPWPDWDPKFDKRRPYQHHRGQDLPCYELRIRDLAKAGALIAAEIDRLQRRVEMLDARKPKKG